MAAYGIRHTLLVQPNSGYGADNACLLDALARHGTAYKGIAIVAPDASLATLRALKDQGVTGIAFNPTVLGLDHYRTAAPLLERLADLDMLLNLQIEADQIDLFAPWVRSIPLRLLIDHCGRPDPAQGLDQPGFRTLLSLAETGRTWVKLSGYAKFARTPYPFEDAWPYVRALTQAFTLDRCLWASDWPYLRAPVRQDIGPLLALVETLFPDPADRARLFWDTPNRLLAFAP